MYHRGWGRAGDAGYVAEEAGRRVGAVWYRLFTESEHGKGMSTTRLPSSGSQSSTAFAARRRRRLLDAMHERARQDGLSAWR